MKKYKCTECDWIGTEEEMNCDYLYEPGDNDETFVYLCPGCGEYYYDLDDYDVVDVS